MLDARDAYLAADRMRFGGANQAELWTAFARRGFGEKAASADPSEDDGGFGDTDDPDPVPSFESPLRTDESARDVQARRRERRRRSRASCSSATTRRT